MKTILLGTRVSRDKMTEFSVTPSRNVHILRLYVVDGLTVRPTITMRREGGNLHRLVRELDDLTVELESLPIDDAEFLSEFTDDAVRLRVPMNLAAGETVIFETSEPVMGLTFAGVIREKDDCFA